MLLIREKAWFLTAGLSSSSRRLRALRGRGLEDVTGAGTNGGRPHLREYEEYTFTKGMWLSA
jgi:hypothetical protein